MKAENLKILKEHGIRVPKFQVIEWENRNKKINTNKFKGKYAVRSSSNYEDGVLDSFAGQFDTYLNVTPKTIQKRVNQCFKSINNKNVKDYLKKKDIPLEELKMDVIIQEMVKADYSGVIFTANPQGLLNESVIVVGRGLGNNVVEDKTDTTSYYYNLTDSIYYYEGKKEYLESSIIEELISISKKIKDILGAYLDIEFAIEKGKIYILQARPITTLKLVDEIILDNSNIVESYPGLSLPLTISFVKFVYSGVFKKEAYRLTHNQKLVDENNKHFNNMVGSCNGRIYYQISNWYHLIKFLPFSKKIIPIWQDMMGVKNKKYDSKKLSIPLATRIKTYFYTIYEFFKVPKNMDYLNNKFIEINKYFNRRFHEGMTNQEIMVLYRRIKNEILSIWDITLVNDLYSFIYTGLLKKRLKKKKYDENIIQEYISGITNIESLKPIHSLISLAYSKDKVPKDIYLNMKEEYIASYGDRNLEELKLESETFRTNPKLLDKRVLEYRRDKQKLNKLFLSIKERKTKKIKEDFITKYLLKRAMLGIKNREISRLNRSRIYGMVRSMFLEMGKNFVKEKKLLRQKDIFYLTLEEVFSPKKYNLKNLVKERKKEYNSFKDLPAYSRLLFDQEIIEKHPKKMHVHEKRIDKKNLTGIPCSVGTAEGEALVITDVKKHYNVKDKILITKMTDPGWVFLLTTAKGVISEKGSLLSHTAIISREIGIPSIVGVDNLINTIKTGDKIRMNGTTGKIEIIERGKK